MDESNKKLDHMLDIKFGQSSWTSFGTEYKLTICVELSWGRYFE